MGWKMVGQQGQRKETDGGVSITVSVPMGNIFSVLFFSGLSSGKLSVVTAKRMRYLSRVWNRSSAES